MFCTVKVRSAELPTLTVPKLWEDGATEITGAPTLPKPVTVGETVPTLDAMVTVPPTVPAAVGLNRTITGWLSFAPRLKAPPETMLKGAVAVTVPERVPPPMFCTVKVRSAELPTLTGPMLWVGGFTETAGTVP